ncbi:unnamed protein product, partial [Larinioides sclopetarius]
MRKKTKNLTRNVSSTIFLASKGNARFSSLYMLTMDIRQKMRVRLLLF